MNEARTGWFQRHLEADRNRFRVAGGGVSFRLFEVEPEDSLDIVYTILNTAKHTAVTHSGQILNITVSLVDMSHMVVTASACLRV